MFTLFGFSVVPECYILIFPKLNFFCEFEHYYRSISSVFTQKAYGKIWKADMKGGIG